MRKIAWLNTFLERLFPTQQSIGGETTVIIDLPADLYYKELAIYTASSLIGNAISRSEIKCFIDGKPEKNQDHFLLNVSPNMNETSSMFWHKVVNKMIRKGKAVVVEANGKLYCADSCVIEQERPVLGDIYGGVTVGNFQFNKIFTQDDCYVFRLDDINVKQLVDGMYQEYGKILSAAAQTFKKTNGQKYKLRIEGVRSGDEEFEKQLIKKITAELKNYMEGDNAVYLEYDGYTLEPDETTKTPRTSDDFIKLRSDLFKTVAGAMHIPESLLTGNITNMTDIIGAFLTFGVDPYADAITEGLNKRAGAHNYVNGNYYFVDTGKIKHRDPFDIAASVSNLISSGTYCIDEVREELGKAPLNTEWSRKHFITKNFEELERFLKNPGGETDEKKSSLSSSS